MLLVLFLRHQAGVFFGQQAVDSVQKEGFAIYQDSVHIKNNCPKIAHLGLFSTS
jgi:hypothetical protein